MDLLIYHRPDCPFCWKLRIGIEELRLSTEEVITRLGEKHPDVLELSPTGTVPVMVDRDAGLVIWESAVALEYVNDQASGSLMGNSAAERARIRMIAAYSDKVVGSALTDIIFEKRAKPEAEWDHARIARGTALWQDMLDRLEGWIGDKSFFDGDFAAADCALGARFGLAEAYGVPVTPRHPRLHDWYARVRERPSFMVTRPAGLPLTGSMGASGAGKGA